MLTMGRNTYLKEDGDQCKRDRQRSNGSDRWWCNRKYLDGTMMSFHPLLGVESGERKGDGDDCSDQKNPIHESILDSLDPPPAW